MLFQNKWVKKGGWKRKTGEGKHASNKVTHRRKKKNPGIPSNTGGGGRKKKGSRGGAAIDNTRECKKNETGKIKGSQKLKTGGASWGGKNKEVERHLKVGVCLC